MNKIDKNNLTGLTKEKKELMKQLMGSASSPEIDYNKIKEELEKHSHNN